jgi:hypothetical protein
LRNRRRDHQRTHPDHHGNKERAHIVSVSEDLLKLQWFACLASERASERNRDRQRSDVVDQYTTHACSYIAFHAPRQIASTPQHSCTTFRTSANRYKLRGIA